MSTYECMRYATLDVEQSPPAAHLAQYHVVISTNCVHATRNATSSLSNLRSMLRPEGFLALVEFTNGLYWFDLVYGLLDGWWVFEDGRKHELADTSFWEKSLLNAGFDSVSWSDGDTPESRTLRLICGFNSSPSPASEEPQATKRAGIPMETVTWKEVDGLKLNADIYYPPESSCAGETERPLGQSNPS